jgi:hypothetical protein
MATEGSQQHVSWTLDDVQDKGLTLINPGLFDWLGLIK